jgi:hypothetical protein
VPIEEKKVRVNKSVMRLKCLCTHFCRILSKKSSLYTVTVSPPTVMVISDALGKTCEFCFATTKPFSRTGRSMVKSAHPIAFSDKIWVRSNAMKVHLFPIMSACIIVWKKLTYSTAQVICAAQDCQVGPHKYETGISGFL